MRDFKRVDVFLDKLKELWSHYPDLRFIQIINLLDISGHGDPFYFEESLWCDIFDKAIKQAEEYEAKNN